jgi:hypothetical protein
LVVIRFPKSEAYGNKVVFDETAINAEYAGTKTYYTLANQVKPGMCPEFYHYHVEQNKTFTVESYAGKNVNLENLTFVEAFQAGAEVGEFFRNMNGADHGLKGFGYLQWNGDNIEGQLQSDVSLFISEENEEYLSNFKEFVDKYDQYIIHPNAIYQLEECIRNRDLDEERVVFTNQDISPENILIQKDGKISLIDPVPILYSGDSMAGNFLNLYNTLFPTFYNAPRYAKHNFGKFEDLLQTIANGFLEGYSNGDSEIKKRVKQEEYIRLTNLTVSMFKLSQSEELTSEQRIRFGEKEDIINRLPVLVRRIEEFQWNVDRSGTKLV